MNEVVMYSRLISDCVYDNRETVKAGMRNRMEYGMEHIMEYGMEYGMGNVEK